MICGIMLFPRFTHYWRKVNSKREVNSLFHEGKPSRQKLYLFEGKAFQFNNFTLDGFFFQFAFSLLLNAALYQGLHRLLKHN